MERISHQIVILGTNGTGKTTLLEQMIQKAAKNNRRSLIVVSDPIDWREVEEISPVKDLLVQNGFSGVRKVVYESDQITLGPIKDYYFDGLLIFDDCRAYLSSKTPQDLKNIFIRRRQNMRDVILVGHGFTDIPPQYFTYTSMFILFKTVENISRRKNVILNYDKIKQAVDRVNRIAETNHHYKEEFYV